MWRHRPSTATQTRTVMKLLVVCIILALSGMQRVFAASAVGLYAPDRYDGIPDMCLMPMDFGYCRAKVKRYYFDTRRMKCTMFYWGGCAGNVNNFKSLEECNKICLDAYETEQDDDGVRESGVRSRGNYTNRSAGSSNSGGVNNDGSSSSNAVNSGSSLKSVAASSNSFGNASFKSKIQIKNFDEEENEYDPEQE